MGNKLTILTVSYKSEALLRFNLELTERLNPKEKPRWLIVDNDCSQNSPLAKWNSENVSVLDGLPSPVHGRSEDRGSLHHGQALDLALPKVKTRFLLVIDPDFFVVRNDWIQFCLEYVQSQALHFFGASWNPSLISKFHTFPCAHFLMVDLHRVDPTKLTFTPTPAKRRILREGLKRLHQHAKPNSLTFRLLHLLRTISDVGASRDTGYNVYSHFARLPATRTECLEFAVDSESERLIRSRHHAIPTLFRGLTKRFLYSQPPKMFVDRGNRAAEVDHFAPEWTRKGIGWDEFWWQGAPFGVHLRRVSQTAKSNSDCEVPYEDSIAWSKFAEKLVGFKRWQFPEP